MSKKIPFPNYSDWHSDVTTEKLKQMAKIFPVYATIVGVSYKTDGIAYLVQEKKDGDCYGVCIDGNRRLMPHPIEFYIQYGHAVRPITPGYAAIILASLNSDRK